MQMRMGIGHKALRFGVYESVLDMRVLRDLPLSQEDRRFPDI